MLNVANSEIFTIINMLSSEKDISKDLIVSFIEEAFKKIAEGYYSNNKGELVVKLQPNTGEISIFNRRNVVNTIKEADEILLSDAKKIDPNIIIGESILVRLPSLPKQRVSASLVKNFIIDKIKSTGSIHSIEFDIPGVIEQRNKQDNQQIQIKARSEEDNCTVILSYIRKGNEFQFLNSRVL